MEQCLPDVWGNGYDNVVVCCTVENQRTADERLPIFNSLPLKHRIITAQPLLENIEIEKYLYNIESVTVGGESDKFARPLNYDWVLNIRSQCQRQSVGFNFRQCGTHFIKDGMEYTLQVKVLCKQAKLANIDLSAKKNATEGAFKLIFIVLKKR